MGGLRKLEKEAVHPDDTSVKMKRKIKPRGVESTRRSDIQLGEDIVIEKIEFGVKSRSLKALRKGGNGGRIRSCDEKEWNYFPSIRLHSHLEREKNISQMLMLLKIVECKQMKTRAVKVLNVFVT